MKLRLARNSTHAHGTKEVLCWLIKKPLKLKFQNLDVMGLRRNDELIDLSNISLDISKLYLLTINTNNYMLMIAYSSLAFVLARGQP